MSETKENLRQEARRHRALINPGAGDSEAAANYFFEAIHPLEGRIVAGYCAAGREFDPFAILQRLLNQGIRCCLPVVRENSLELGFSDWREDSEMVKGAHGIYHPANTDWLEPDILIVPLLAFDRRGYRLGHGGGYYDATLAALRSKKDVIAVGVAYAEQACLFNLPVEDHDQKLDWVITPKGTHYFN